MIPLSVPYLNGNELKYVTDCINSGWISSAGSYVKRFEDSVANFVGAKHGIACMNGTVGLHISQIICDVKPRDYVIVPNLTFVATLNSVRYIGASPILIDVTPCSWQMNLDLLENFLKTKTELRKENNRWFSFNKSDGKRISAIIIVHALGNITNIQRLVKISNKHHITLIEDSAESLGSYYNEKHSGTFGKAGIFSFNGNKIISTGGGGVIVTDDEELARRAKHLTTTAKVDPINYIHDSIGYNYRLVNILAAVGLAQMEQLPEILKRKKKHG